jgi:hypothetical protein
MTEEFEVTVGRAGIGAAMMQMNRAVSVDDGDDDLCDLEVTVGRAGIGAAMMQTNRVSEDNEV